MSWTQTKSSQCCATCANWAGARTTNGNAVVTEHPNTRGKCYAGVTGSATQGPQACDGRSCGKYSTWAALK